MDESPLIDPPVQRMALTDGRILTWQEFGLPDGRPTLFFHGGGSLSLEAGIFHRDAVREGLRLIATNRPGAGDTTLCPGRPVSAYSNDLVALLAQLGVGRFACFGESNGGLVALATAATLSERVVGAVPINPTLPWTDPLARSVSSGTAATAYWMLRYVPWLVAVMAAGSGERLRLRRSRTPSRDGSFNALDLAGPPPGTEADIAEVHWRMMKHMSTRALVAEMKWSISPWGFDYYSIPVPLDFFCGVHDLQAPFAKALAERSPDGLFHSFPYGHHGFSHPDARRRIIGTISGYFSGSGVRGFVERICPTS